MKKGHPNCWFRLARVLVLWTSALDHSPAGAEVDVAKLPPAASSSIDFVRDVQPILDNACVRCHGPERPRSGFRLDSREAALKGGENGVAIVPGKSAESRLIHFVARLVPDLEMPPEGKGKPLTAEEVGVLRAWIDQGAPWDKRPPTNLFDVTISSTVGGIFVDGNQSKFREHYWRTDGVDGGLDRFELFQQIDPDTRLTVTGSARVNDYRAAVNLDRRDLGFIHTGWSQYRQYYDDTGGPFHFGQPEPLSLDKDLHLDIGRAWIDFGLTLPHWPRMVLGYEFDYKRGDEAITSWGFNGVSADARNIAPNRKHLDESVHIIRFDLDTEVAGVAVEDRFRGEFYSLDTHYTNIAARAEMTQNARSENTYFQGANSLRLEKRFKDWLLGSGGYFYSKLDAESSFTNSLVANGTVYSAYVPEIILERESHVFNLNGLLGPFDGLTISAGLQNEWTSQNGIGSGNLNGIAFTLPPGSNLAIRPAELRSDYDQSSISETIGVRYHKIPFTALFADARLKQESIGQSGRDIQTGTSFVENPSIASELTDFRLGFNTSPWQRISLSGHYRRYEDDTHYRTNQSPQPPGGYPGFLRWRELITDEVETKLVVRPNNWLKLNLSYQFLTTDYRQDTRPAFTLVPPRTYSPGGEILAGEYDAHIYSLGFSATPHPRVFLSGTFSYQDSTTTTESTGLISPYKGNIYSAIANSTYAVNQRADMSLSYSFSLADFAQPNPGPDSASPPPLGIRYQQHALLAVLTYRVNQQLTTRLQYGFFLYDEPTAGTANDYRAQMAFASLIYHFR